jgi:uncharacterized membrane protein YedE/YeeE
LAVAVGGLYVASQAGFVELGDHRYLSTNLPVAAIVLGGLAFGIGMVLTRGCVSRLTVLSATGNLRAITVLAVFAIVAHAALKGVFAPVRTSLGSISIDLPFASFSEIPMATLAITAALFALALWQARQSKASPLHLGLGAVIGLVAVAGWAGTSTLLMDEFDPAPVQSIAFTLPWSDSLFWVVASSAIPAGFGVGLIGGVLAGAFISAAARGELELVSFTSPNETLRYASGGALMGIGGVLAGGCTIGAGLGGGATLSIAALLALASIVTGGIIARRVLGSSVPQTAMA